MAHTCETGVASRRHLTIAGPRNFPASTLLDLSLRPQRSKIRRCFDRAKFWRYARYTVLTVALPRRSSRCISISRAQRVRGTPLRAAGADLRAAAGVARGLRIAQIDVVRELQEAATPRGRARATSAGSRTTTTGSSGGAAVRVLDGLQPAKRVRVAFEGGAVKAVQDAEGATCRSRAWSPWPSVASIPQQRGPRTGAASECRKQMGRR